MNLQSTIWTLLALLSMPAGVLAAVTFTNSEYYTHEGVPFTITWTGNRGPVTVTLMNGPDANLVSVLVIISDYNAQEYTWTPPPTLPADSYLLRVEDAGSTDYSPRFRYPAPLPISTTSSSGSTPTTTPSTSTPTPTIPATDSNPGSHETLSTPAKAAIATLGGLLLLALLALFAYYVAHRRRKLRDEREGLGGELPLSAVTVGTYTQQSPGMGTVVGDAGYGAVGFAASGSGVVHMKVEGVGAQHGQQGGGEGYGDGDGYGRAELPGREVVEMSADGRYLR